MTNVISRGGTFLLIGTGAFSVEALQVLYDLRWMLALIVVLIVADFWYGLSESLQKREHFRFSRAGRRTCNKFMDYVGYLLLGTFFGLGIFEPLGIATHVTTAAVGLAFGCVWEVDSIVGHVCALHGIRNRFSVKRFIISLLKKRNPDVGEALEETLSDGVETPPHEDKVNNK